MLVQVLIFDGKQLSDPWQQLAVFDDLMLKTGISQLAYEKTVLVYKAPSPDATHKLPNPYHPVAVGPHRETGSDNCLSLF